MNATKKKEVTIVDRFIFNNREDLMELLNHLEGIKYERMYMVYSKKRWYIVIKYKWLEEEEA